MEKVLMNLFHGKLTLTGKMQRVVSSMGLSSEQFEGLVNSCVKPSRFPTINLDNRKAQLAELLIYQQKQLLHANREAQIKEILEYLS